jgi:hypothetical protein
MQLKRGFGSPGLALQRFVQQMEMVMTLRLGDTAPDFTQDSTEGPIRFHDWIGQNWAVLFSRVTPQPNLP